MERQRRSCFTVVSPQSIAWGLWPASSESAAIPAASLEGAKYCRKSVESCRGRTPIEANDRKQDAMSLKFRQNFEIPHCAYSYFARREPT